MPPLLGFGRRHFFQFCLSLNVPQKHSVINPVKLPGCWLFGTIWSSFLPDMSRHSKTSCSLITYKRKSPVKF